MYTALAKYRIIMMPNPSHQVILSENDWGVRLFTRFPSIVFWFHYDSRKRIGFLRMEIYLYTYYYIHVFCVHRRHRDHERAWQKHLEVSWRVKPDFQTIYLVLRSIWQHRYYANILKMHEDAIYSIGQVPYLYKIWTIQKTAGKMMITPPKKKSPKQPFQNCRPCWP